MAKKTGKSDDILLQPPRLTVLGDEPLAPADADADSFDLRVRVGPVYDILRHPDTQTPMTIAIYGAWGAGKTTAMKWLEGRLDTWNKKGKGKDKITVRTAWFRPWKYQSKEDVWRGLVAEVIIACLKGKSGKAVLGTLRDLGGFLGGSLIDLVAGTKLSLGAPGTAKVTADGKAIEKIKNRAKDFVSPQNAYLNEFEAALKAWIKKTLGKNERMVVFIDDLDRCLPEVALQVLEALKLYLDIEKLIFVAGVDRGVVDALVREHYKNLGLAEDKSGDYLAKMFQVEMTVGPSDPQIETFLESMLAANATWQDLEGLEQEVFREIILNLGVRSPREVKRLINSSLIAGAGARLSVGADETEEDGTAAGQGMLVYFVHRILENRHTRGTLVGGRLGTRFFTAWSEVVRGNPDAPRTVRVPESFVKALGERDERRRPDDAPDSAVQKALAGLPEHYHDLLSDRTFAPLLDLLRDEDLGSLMRLPYPAEAEAAAIGATLGGTESADIVREAIARELNKKPEEVSADDYTSVTALTLIGSDISDFAPLADLKSLSSLELNDAQVSDLTPLAGLSNLELLFLDGTQITDLAPLANLKKLRLLSLERTQVTDLAPLSGLSSLRSIYLDGTQVADEAVAELQEALPGLVIER